MVVKSPVSNQLISHIIPLSLLKNEDPKFRLNKIIFSKPVNENEVNKFVPFFVVFLQFSTIFHQLNNLSFIHFSVCHLIDVIIACGFYLWEDREE